MEWKSCSWTPSAENFPGKHLHPCPHSQTLLLLLFITDRLPYSYSDQLSCTPSTAHGIPSPLAYVGTLLQHGPLSPLHHHSAPSCCSTHISIQTSLNNKFWFHVFPTTTQFLCSTTLVERTASTHWFQFLSSHSLNPLAIPPKSLIRVTNELHAAKSNPILDPYLT